jgi:PAS domain S-box-containing protein
MSSTHFPAASTVGIAHAGIESARVLLVEDDENSAFILRKILSRTSHQITGVARTSEQALKLFADTKPDLLLMDIHIPGDRDGVETVEQILRGSDPIIIYLTASSDEPTIARARRTAPFAYLLKPYREKEVLITLEMALYKARLDRVNKATEQRLAATLGAMEDYVLTTDDAGRITYLNPAAERGLGTTAQARIGQLIGELLDLRERDTRTRLPDLTERLLEPGFHTEPPHPLLLITSRGDAQLVQVNTSTLASPGSGDPGRVIILRDVTQLSQLEENIRQAQKLEAVGRLAGGIAHDFNNLLAIINSFADLLLIKTPPGGPYEKYYQNIRTAGQRGADLVARLMTFSRRSSFAPCPVAPADVVNEVHKMIRPLIRENIELTVQSAGNLPLLHANPGQIEQILVNLCLNARDAIHEAGSITINLIARHFNAESALKQSLEGPGEYVLLSVADTGSGIPAELREKIFEPFFTTKEVGKGTGLGLAMVYSMVRQNHGHIEVESEPGRGTVFTIYLPAYEAAKETVVERDPEANSAPGGHERVLLVEDDAHFAECIKHLLEMHGYAIVTAASGEEALQHFKEHQGAFDLLLTDMVLPKISGVTLAVQLRQQRPNLRVMLMTGYENLEIGAELGGNMDRMEKPFSLNTLLARVRVLLDKAETAVPAQ